MTDEQKTVDLVLEGGGVKGTALLGAVLTLYDAGYRFERIAGTSAGAIMASLIAGYQKAGRNLHELEEVAASLDYRKFQQDSPQKRMSRIGRMTNLALRDGEHSGQYLIDWLGPVLEGVGVTTFADLRVDDPDSSLPPDRSYALVVHTSDISRGAMVRLPWDYHEYGHQADQQLVVDAVRASMSVPFFFEPVTVPTDSGEVTWVDGSLLSNFPITCFDRTDGKPSRWPTWGIKLSSIPDKTRDEPIKSAIGMAEKSLHTMLAEWNIYALEEEGVNRRTIFVDTTGVSTLDFNISTETRQRLVTNGQSAAGKFLKQLPSS